ncbi:MAG: hypothetical protein BWZ10_02612 [candidate division BRC1 bacterium ADurb.BinA364]|nr:MAG: hypothetical protein BWZ10_02612 [candidate division BRC1 bacterium ADurb.BinA364]
MGRGVLDLMLAGPEARLDLGGGVAVRSHISSPEVFLNDAERRFYMIFHSPSPIGQISFLATSASGLNFNRPGEGGERGEGVRPFILSPSPYMRLFYKDGTAHAVCHSGYFARPVDPSRPWEIADSLKPAEPSWEVLPRSIFIEEIKSLLGREDELESGALALRHCSLRTSGDGRALEVFFSRAFESPEHILHAVVDISPKDWREWRLMGPPAKLLCAEEPWEGECLHDTHVFEDVGGQLYLFYSCREEDAIAVAKLHAL